MLTIWAEAPLVTNRPSLGFDFTALFFLGNPLDVFLVRLSSLDDARIAVFFPSVAEKACFWPRSVAFFLRLLF